MKRGIKMFFTKELLKLMRQEFAKDIQGFEKRFNVKVELGSISFNECEFTSKLKVTSNEENAEQKMFENVCHLYGLNKEHYGYVFKARTKNGMQEFKLCGFDNGRSKYPIKAKSVIDDSVLLFTTDVVKNIAWQKFELKETDADGNPITK